MADTYREQAQELAPRGLFLRDPISQAYLSASGGTVADTTALVRAGILQRYARTCDDTALAAIGDTRGLERAPREAADAFRTRCARTIEIHQAIGTKEAYQEALLPLGIAPENIVVWNDHEDTILPATSPDTPWWSRCMVIVDSTSGPWSAPVWSEDDMWSEDDVWGIEGITRSEVIYLRRIIRQWKWAAAYPLALVIIFDNTPWPLSTNWSSTTAWVGDTDVAIMPIGRVWGFNEAVYGSPPELWMADEAWHDNFDFED